MGFKPLAWDGARRASTPAEATRPDGENENLPGKLLWRSGLLLQRLDPAWRVVYARDGEPVLAERAYGKGTLVLATDSFFASNEALRDERQSALLAWLVGPSRRALFDETHLAISENLGVMSLALKYRLHGMLAVLGVLAALFVWKGASPLVPVGAEGSGSGRAEAGRDAFAGLVDLLLRNVGRDRVLRVCLEEWTRASAGKPGAKEIARRLTEELERNEADGKRNVAETYRAMAGIAGRKKAGGQQVASSK